MIRELVETIESHLEDLRATERDNKEHDRSWGHDHTESFKYQADDDTGSSNDVDSSVDDSNEDDISRNGWQTRQKRRRSTKTIEQGVDNDPGRHGGIRNRNAPENLSDSDQGLEDDEEEIEEEIEEENDYDERRRTESTQDISEKDARTMVRPKTSRSERRPSIYVWFIACIFHDEHFVKEVDDSIAASNER